MVTQKAWLWALSARLQFGNRGVRLVLLGFDLPPARPAALVQRILFGHAREDAVDFRILGSLQISREGQVLDLGGLRQGALSACFCGTQ
jgi:hypothetical protein